MDRLYEWVDAKPPSPGRRFSGRRTVKLFVAIMVGSILSALPMGLIELGVKSATHAQEEHQKREQLKRHLMELEKGAREGQAGEASRRLFGLDAPPQTTGRQIPGEVKGPGGGRP